MLRPIPLRILRSTATVKVCTGTDMYQNQIYATYTVEHVHLQPEERIVKTVQNTDAQLTGTLYVDVRHSKPQLDWRALLQQSHDNGGDMRVIVRGIEYTVMMAELLRDGTDKPHHWEISMI